MDRFSSFWVFFLPPLGAAAAGLAVSLAVRPDAPLDWAVAWTVTVVAALAAAQVSRAVVRWRLHVVAEEAQRGQIGLSAAVPGLLPLLETLRESKGQAELRFDALQQTAAQLATVLEGMQDAVIALDDQQRIVFANRVAVRLLQLPEGGAAGRHLLQVIRDHRVAQLVNDCQQHGKPQSRELLMGGPDPSQVEVCAAQAEAPWPGVVLVFHDLTNVRRLESVRRDFVTNVSHELKTPLSSIRAYAETLAEGAVDDAGKRGRFCDQIIEQSDRLLELILDLISLARIESGRQTFEVADVRLQPLVESCLNHRREAAAQRGVVLSMEIDEQTAVRADEEAVRQILDNLLDNAVKYSSDGEVAVSARRAEGHWELRVRDTGVGIPAEHQSRVFERFYRVDRARARELGGTGLGLAIVKHLAHAFEGAVGVESEVGVGSTFWVRLPAAEVPQTTEA